MIFRSEAVKELVKLQCELGNGDELQSEFLEYFGENNTKICQPKDKELFKKARETEFEGLLYNNKFAIVDKSEVPIGMRIYGTRFVDA